MDDEQTFLELAAQMMAEGIDLSPLEEKAPSLIERIAARRQSPGAEVLEEAYGPDWRDGVSEVPEQDAHVDGQPGPSEAWQALAARHAEAAKFVVRVNRITAGLAACVGVFIGVGLDALVREVVR